MSLFAVDFTLPPPQWGFPHFPFWPALAVTVAVVLTVLVVERRKSSSDNPGQVSAAAALVCTILVAGTLFTSWEAQKVPLENQWKTDLQAWTAKTYGLNLTDAAAHELLTGRAVDPDTECRSDLACHYVDRLVDGRVQRLELVTVAGETALFVGDRELERR